MTVKLGIVMDPIENIKIAKDTSFAILQAAQKRGWQLYYMQQKDLFLQDGKVFGRVHLLTVKYDPQHWFELHAEQVLPLTELNVILMRKDPPFDMNYIYTTYLLEQAERHGVVVINKPQGLRDANEKLFTSWFAHCCPPTLVSSDPALLKKFLAEQKNIILKPLDGMGGKHILQLKQGDVNSSVVMDMLTKSGKEPIMAQRFIPEIIYGDKRIIMINGEPVPYALARIPAAGEIRGNIAAGGSVKGQPLSDRDKWICQQVGPKLKEKGLLFVGLDVIGDYLTEVNVTSPTCVCELEKLFKLKICDQFLDEIAC